MTKRMLLTTISGSLCINNISQSPPRLPLALTTYDNLPKAYINNISQSLPRLPFAPLTSQKKGIYKVHSYLSCQKKSENEKTPVTRPVIGKGRTKFSRQNKGF